MTHIKIEIAASERQQEELIALLEDSDVTGFEQKDDLLIAYFEQEKFDTNAIAKHLSGYQYKLSTIEAQNWNATWEKSFSPVVIEDFCAIRADFHKPVTGVAHEIIITPKMSFGTGHHATTYMMMAQMKDLDFAEKSVFDFGTGTGILAILAAKLGATNVTAIDNDSWCLANAIENIEINNCNQVQIFLSAEISNNTYDVILANINRNIIADNMNNLKRAMKPDGKLLMSGLLREDEDYIVSMANESGLRLIRRMEKMGWLSLLLKID